MANDQTERLFEEVLGLLEDAIANGDNVSAIARRAGLHQPDVSKFRNKSHVYTPKLDTILKIANALGYDCRIELKKY